MTRATAGIATIVIGCIGILMSTDVAAQGWNSDDTASVERRRLGVFDKKPLFQRTLRSGTGDDARYRIEVFWADDPAAYEELSERAKKSDGELELVELEALTVVLTDEGASGAFPELSTTKLEAKENRLTLVDWPPIEGEPPYDARRTRIYEWDRKKKRFKLARTEMFLPKVDRFVRLERATRAKRWNDAWRAALALDPFVETSDTPGCDRLVGLATLDLLIAHLDVLLADNRADDAHRILSLAFKFGGPRSVGCGLTSSGLESRQPAAFSDGATFEIERCAATVVAVGKKKRCAKNATFGKEWRSATKTRMALLSFAEFAAARGDIELVERLLSGMAELHFHDETPPERYASKPGKDATTGSLQVWSKAWTWLGDEAEEDGFSRLASALYQLALDSKDADELASAERDRIEPKAAKFEAQKVEPEEVGDSLSKLLDEGELLFAVGEIERYSRVDLRAAGIDNALIRKPVIAAFEERLEALKKDERKSLELSDLRALRGKARWLTPMGR